MNQAQALVATAAAQLTASARRHKQAASQHRRAAQADMQAVERLRADCARLGIKLVLPSETDWDYD